MGLLQLHATVQSFNTVPKGHVQMCAADTGNVEPLCSTACPDWLTVVVPLLLQEALVA